MKGGVYFAKPLNWGPKMGPGKKTQEVLEFRILPRGVHLKSSSILFPKVDDITDLHHVAVQN